MRSKGKTKPKPKPKPTAARELTGRMLGVLRPELRREFLEGARRILGVELRDARQFKEGTDLGSLPQDLAVHFERFGLVGTSVRIEQPKYAKYFSLTAPEGILPAPVLPREIPATVLASSCAQDSLLRTWGLEVTGAFASSFDGRGIKVAVLDSGIDLDHEAFRDMRVTARSFVSGTDTKDHHGHGTHCAASICGQHKPGTRRFSVAPGVELFVAKVFDAAMKSPDQRTIDAIQWAMDEGCAIISMSLGGRIANGTPHVPALENIAAQANAQNVLLIAGVGNDSDRSHRKFVTVNSPANCPSILAVGAIDECRAIANNSNRKFDSNGGEVNLVAPGLRIQSAKANGTHKMFRPMSGTSAATPIVAGIAALWAQARPGVRGKALGDLVCNNAKPLSIDEKDAGKGLVRAP